MTEVSSLFRSLKKNKASHIQKICHILLFTFLVNTLTQPLVMSVARASEVESQITSIHQALVDVMKDPILEAIRKDPNIPDRLGISISDPTIDEDPFLMRSQSWVELNNSNVVDPSDEGDSPSYQFYDQGVMIQVPGLNRAWKLNAPLNPILFTDEYVFFSLKADSPLFEKASRGLDSVGQGIFVVEYRELLAASSEKSPVPVYFFPMPGTGWNSGSQVQALEFSRHNLVVFAGAGGEKLPVQLDDISDVIKAEKLNLLMATSKRIQGLRFLRSKEPIAVTKVAGELNELVTKMQKASAEMMSKYFVLSNKLLKLVLGNHLVPARGATAGFGMLYTGYDLDHPENSTFQAKNQFRFLDPLREFFSPKSAFAGEEKSDRDKLMDRLQQVALIMAFSLIAGVALRYTVLKDRFAAMDLKAGPATSAWKKTKREGEHLISTYASVLATFSQFSNIWTGNITEAVGDRFFSSAMSAENSVIRKFLNETVYYVRGTSERAQANAKTWFYGTSLGTVDTAFVYVQLFYAAPWISAELAEHVPALKSRVEEAYRPGNHDVFESNVYDLVRNFSYYGTAAPTVLSVNQRDEFRTMAASEIEKQMIQEGKNIRDPHVRLEYEKRLSEFIDIEMQKMGYPDSSAFLFDAGTLYNQILNLIGYAIPEKQKEKTTYLGELRPALTIPALKRGLKLIELRLKAHPNDPDLKAAKAIFEYSIETASSLNSFVEAPIAALGFYSGSQGSFHDRLEVAKKQFLFYINKFRIMRQQLLLLTYDAGGVGPIKNIPNDWVEHFGEKGASLAAKFYRLSFMSLVTGDKSVFGPTLEQKIKYEAFARFQADRDFYYLHLDEGTFDGGRSSSKDQQKLKEKYALEYDMMVEQRIMSAIRDDEAKAKLDAGYKPEKKDFLARWQERRAERKTDEEFLKLNGRVFDESTATESEIKQWQEIYAKNLMHTVGLYPDFTESPQLKKSVEDQAEKMLEDQIAANPVLEKHLDDLRQKGELFQAKTLMANLYTQNLTTAYIQQTVHRDWKALSPLDPNQPGRLQRLRQTSFIKSSKLATRLCRAAEALTPNTSYKVGVKSFLERNVPGYADFVMGNIRMARALVTSATGAYAFNFAVWGMNPGAMIWTSGKFLAFTVTMPSQMLSRGLRMQGWAPMGKYSMLMLYAVAFSWATFWGTIPQQLFLGDYRKAWETATAPLAPVSEWVKKQGRQLKGRTRDAYAN